MKATFAKDKITPRAVRFKEEGEPALIGYVYVRKAEAQKLGDRITVTVEPA